MAAIDQRTQHSWRARVRIPGFAQKTRTFDTEAEAREWAARIERELRARRDTIPNVRVEPTFDEALERYEREITGEKKGHEQERRRICQWRRRELAKLKLSALTSQYFIAFRPRIASRNFVTECLINRVTELLLSIAFLSACGPQCTMCV